MARRLQIDELASEAGASVELIERLTEIGVLRPQPDGWYGAGDLIRLEALNAFLDAGVSVDQLAAALTEGVFTFEYLDRFHPEPPPATGHTFQEFTNTLAVSSALVKSIYQAMGLPEPTPDRPTRQDEEDLIGRFLNAWKIGSDEETYLRAARLIGEPARQVSEGWTRLYVEKVSDPMVGRELTGEERVAAIVESTEELTRLAPPLLLWLFHRHLRNAIDRANIDGLERELVAHGLSLPTPERPPAISFVDISGYTTLTEVHGDELAARTADRLRDLAERSARAHGGTVVKLLGDGVMLHFATVTEGLAGVLELVDNLGAGELAAHAGMHAGPLIEHDGDYFGRTVNLASRVAGVAEPGEVVVTEAVALAAANHLYSFEPLPPVTLKGIADHTVLFRAGLKSS
ncbi:MAG TPA: adenylate/guanylate cyclase domain-containing protein [Acidimicrobiia bacterium]|nr:adenylate/guanylate cyclase domain-containing protein [Acidimicrobiia bacterium]